MRTKFSSIYGVLFIGLFLLMGCERSSHKSWIRINQLGYTPDAIKVAVFGSKNQQKIDEFSLFNADTDEFVIQLDKVKAKGAYGPFTTSFRLDFSSFEEPGSYYIMAKGVKSPVFPINEHVFNHTADYLLKYMRQQRCGFNPFFKDSCHLNDGFTVYHPEKEDGTYIDVTGGWHDATDYLQYVPTSANAVFQLLFAYRENPNAFGDRYQDNGLEGSNGIPDVIDEAKFGMDWLLKMNPSIGEFYNQIADDRDHAGFRLPTQDSVVYHSKFEGRPVYFVTGTPQGLFKYKNRTKGVSSTAGKFASAFALGTEVLQPFFPEYAASLFKKAEDAYNFAMTKPGFTQTAPGKAPYFYEEENWFDDMELAAGVLYRISKNTRYKTDALTYASKEQVSPWMGKDTARHYQYYPFLNVGHHELASTINTVDREKVLGYYRKGLELIYDRGSDNPFLIGIPFIWCSSNYLTAGMTQANLYRNLTGDTTYAEMEAALRDWLFGCNPWGTSMVVGLPEHGDYPANPHSSLNHLYGYQTFGGLVDGPVYASIFNNLKGIQLMTEDDYADFQSDVAVYHDDVGDYATNEPTMDGVASLVYYLSSLHSDTDSE